MIVVADATPLRYLILIEAVAILPALYERILIPAVVAEELQRPRTPLPVRQWMASPPRLAGHPCTPTHDGACPVAA